MELRVDYIKEASTAEDLILDETLIAPTSRRQPYFESCNLAMLRGGLILGCM